MLYLFKASLVLSVCYVVYWLLFRRDTFHQTKRLVLLAGLVFSIALPFLQIDVWQTPVSIEPTQAASVPLEYWLLLQQAQPLEENTASATEIGLLAYGSVCLLMTLWLVVRLYRLLRFLQTAQYYSVDDYSVAVHPQVKTPFSFFGWMLLPENLPDDALRSQILIHESAHIRQWHTLDILLMELYLVFFWFNPLAWLYRRQVRLNLEYLADSAVLHCMEDNTDYQMNLLRIGVSPTHLSLANHFHFSSLKNRILMMNRPDSPAYARLKYAILPVLLTGLVSVFHLTQAENMAASTLLPLPDFSAKKLISSEETAFSTASKPRTIRGTIKDVDTGKPIGGVAVGIMGKTEGVLSATDGTFTLKVEENAKLVFEHPAYITPQIMQVAKNTPAEFAVWLKSTPAATDADNIAKKMVYIVNGQKMTRAELEAIPKKDIESINGNGTVDKDGNGVMVVRLKPKNGIVIANVRKDSSAMNPADALYILDGEKISYTLLRLVNPQDIDNIAVLKDKAATDAYGEEGKNGVIIISTKQSGNLPVVPEKQFPISNPPPLYIVDGTEKSAEEMKKLKPEDIDEVSVIKDKAEAEKKYGTKGKNGVVLIKLKKK
ncbi:MAG: hypothetical protein MUD08_04685 [Cytophagales bacterium]|nr:hypothetical protein [Cytophagales bacterium]